MAPMMCLRRRKKYLIFHSANTLIFCSCKAAQHSPEESWQPVIELAHIHIEAGRESEALKPKWQVRNYDEAARRSEGL
ncbi:hypothetical protein SAMN05216212_3142 [Microbulbifer yueqingensis]|uniref:Uncharacterized protein n=1 Tax=Microbulbifer yueqingensis TaxID=658219 RepID=A0A1G9EI95_9GAMM|nr:hypothetical protein SAMN05216212_3142 [Microbulbifer yueqingensis]